MRNYDVIIIGTGVAGLFAALNLGSDKNILIVTKGTLEDNDSFLAQGGICVQRDETDFEPFLEDTLRAGHYENNEAAVATMITSSQNIISDLIGLGVAFDKQGEGFSYTKEGAHSRARILHCKDMTGKEINSKLIARVKELANVTILENSTLVDLLVADERCHGVVLRDQSGKLANLYAQATLLATGGIGGLFSKSTNFAHLTGDAIAIALKHGIRVKDLDYVQIHPTSLYTGRPGKAFLMSESLRGEGAILVGKDGQRFADELLPRDLLTKEIYAQMEKDRLPYVRMLLKGHIDGPIAERFPGIHGHCLEEGYDLAEDYIPVVPAQHYFMGGIEVDLQSKTSLANLYAAGETSCNGVHGKNRLASNSLLESLVFSKRAAQAIEATFHREPPCLFPEPDARTIADGLDESTNTLLKLIGIEAEMHAK
ncbi:L-aspartate oxidase [Trichococcus ilyis]|uniref:L-aspartate oxidase n=1 Tax=Trichococcus ilyis TaxID=640938 RepID=A0A143YZX9_9LACT|nr:L-aspartate oxidase [Trichococcus ilyis]CZR02765.1 fad-dependent pyridine nucleotide reductase signature [Trichococcus ilyis]SEJ66961.1 L-aspartate oxidase [Trichococcus ilyis]